MAAKDYSEAHFHVQDLASLSNETLIPASLERPYDNHSKGPSYVAERVEQAHLN